MTEVPRSDKQELRARMRVLRRGVSAADARRAGDRAAAPIAALLSSLPACTVLLYAPLPGEVDTRPIDARLRRDGIAIAYPRVVGPATLSLHLARPDELTPGAFAICEPDAAAPTVEPSALDAIVVPGLAFDRAGGRLGFGGGYYDALLRRAPRAWRCGLCLAEQLLASLPVEPHDERLDFVVHDELVVTHARPLPVSQEKTP